LCLLACTKKCRPSELPFSESLENKKMLEEAEELLELLDPQAFF